MRASPAISFGDSIRQIASIVRCVSEVAWTTDREVVHRRPFRQADQGTYTPTGQGWYWSPLPGDGGELSISKVTKSPGPPFRGAVTVSVASCPLLLLSVERLEIQPRVPVISKRSIFQSPI